VPLSPEAVGKAGGNPKTHISFTTPCPTANTQLIASTIHNSVESSPRRRVWTPALDTCAVHVVLHYKDSSLAQILLPYPLAAV
jgi:hypothetical protein